MRSGASPERCGGAELGNRRRIRVDGCFMLGWLMRNLLVFFLVMGSSTSLFTVSRGERID
jgi:hypothetical protein